VYYYRTIPTEKITLSGLGAPERRLGIFYSFYFKLNRKISEDLKNNII